MSKRQTWREYFAPRIAAKISEMKADGASIKDMKRILSKLNPGPYGHHRKTWANEYMIQLGLSKRKGKKPLDSKDQQKLF